MGGRRGGSPIGGSVGEALNNVGNSSFGKTFTAIPGVGSAQMSFLSNGVQGVKDNLSGKNLGDLIAGPSPEAPGAPGMDPTLEQIKQQQIDDAKAFRSNLPNAQRDLYEGAYKTERGNLAGAIRNTRNDANRRGLLYSGIEQGNELRERAGSASNLAKARTDINTGLEDQARQMEADAVQTGLGVQRSKAQIEDQVMSQALANMASRRQGLMGVGQAAGAIGGAAIANGKK